MSRKGHQEGHMPKLLFRVMTWGGLALLALGVVALFISGGWAATGIGTDHSGTLGGVLGAMLFGWGVVMIVTVCFTALMMRLMPRSTQPERSGR
jgi:hypothetical protein